MHLQDDEDEELCDNDDEDDDTHLCYKCNATIIGLNNYIVHRKNNCKFLAKPEYNNYETDDYDDDDDDDDDEEEEDDEEEDEDGNKDIISIEKPEANSYGYNYGHGADVFFSSLQLQSIAKEDDHQNQPQASSSARTKSQIENRSEKLMHAVNHISGNKKVELSHLVGYTHNHQPDESSEDTDDEDDEYYNAPPRTHTGGKWKPASPPVHQSNTTSVVTTTTTASTSVHYSPHHPNNWTVFEPSTSGKWKSPIDEFVPTDFNQPIWMTPIYKSNTDDDKIVYGTEQFWCNICNRKLASKIVYDRHLKSKLHIKRSQPENELDQAICGSSDGQQLSKRFVKPSVYLNKDIYEIGDDKVEKRKRTSTRVSESAKINLLSIKKETTKKLRTRRKHFIKCVVCKSRLRSYLIGKHLISHYHYRRMVKQPESSFNLILENIREIVLQSPFQCQMCRFYTNTEEMFMRHWNSTEHFNRVHMKDEHHYKYRYWCSFCKFEDGDHDKMTEHLIGQDHQETVLAINRSVPIVIKRKTIFSCSVCEPSQEFRFNFELRRHYLLDHAMSDFNSEKFATASNQYQSLYTCSVCNVIKRSKYSLELHKRHDHQIVEFYCDPCQLSFDTQVLAKKHRQSLEHKVNVNKNRRVLKRRCQYCREIHANLIELKRHMKECHPDKQYHCVQCGKNFTFSQGLSIHVRSGKCPFNKNPTAVVSDPSTTIVAVSHHDDGEEMIEEKKFVCDICPYGTSLHADLIFHKILHSVDTSSGDKTIKLTCPFCKYSFSKYSLRYHIRQHTNERDFVCEMCGKTFTRKANLQSHIKVMHETKAKEELEQEAPATEMKFHCQICGKSFNKGNYLKQHLHIHRDQCATKRHECPFADCLFSARSESEVKNHMAIHSDEKNFVCEVPGCDYRGKLKEYLTRHIKIAHGADLKHECPHCDMKFKVAIHLKRHLLTHTGEKPYKCPHCDYSCNAMENLRKHIMSTSKHAGKYLYECKYCAETNDGHNIYQTNYIKEYKAHLYNVHLISG